MSIRAHLMTAAIIVTGGCAVSPHPAPAPKVAAAPTAATPAPKPPEAYDPRRAQVNRMAAELGYHVVMQDQKRFFCRTAAPLGTRLTRKECVSEETMSDTVTSIVKSGPTFSNLWRAAPLASRPLRPNENRRFGSVCSDSPSRVRFNAINIASVTAFCSRR